MRNIFKFNNIILSTLYNVSLVYEVKKHFLKFHHTALFVYKIRGTVRRGPGGDPCSDH